jgi:cytochrome c oxidase cbb3-type subunit 3
MTNAIRAALLCPMFALVACGADAPAYSEAQLQELRTAAEAHAGQDAATLQQDATAMQVAQQLFDAHCASCHGSDARGRTRVPDLVAAVFDYGSSADAIRATIRDGRHSEMPKFGHLLGEFELGVMSSWVKSFTDGEPLDELYLDTAQQRYAEHCVACHGPELKGNPALGAPDLTDASWQFASSVNGVRMTMTGGTSSDCPPLGAQLGPAGTELLVAYVLKLRAGS